MKEVEARAEGGSLAAVLERSGKDLECTAVINLALVQKTGETSDARATSSEYAEEK